MESLIIQCLMCVAKEHYFFVIDGKGQCGSSSTQIDVPYYEVVPGKSAHNLCYALHSIIEPSTPPPIPSCPPPPSCPAPSIWTTFYQTIIIQLAIQIIFLILYKLFKIRATLLFFFRNRVYNVQRRRENTPDNDSADVDIEHFLRPAPIVPRLGPVINDIINLPNLSPEINQILLPIRSNVREETPVNEEELIVDDEILSPIATPIAARTRLGLNQSIAKPEWFGNRIN